MERVQVRADAQDRKKEGHWKRARWVWAQQGFQAATLVLGRGRYDVLLVRRTEDTWCSPGGLFDGLPFRHFSRLGMSCTNRSKVWSPPAISTGISHIGFVPICPFRKTCKWTTMATLQWLRTLLRLLLWPFIGWKITRVCESGIKDKTILNRIYSPGPNQTQSCSLDWIRSGGLSVGLNRKRLVFSCKRVRLFVKLKKGNN